MATQKQRFDEVVLPNLDTALSLARWLTGNLPDAEDVVQEACLRAFAAIHSASGVNSRAWLLAIVRNTAYTWMSRNRPHQLIVTDDDQVFERAGLEMTGRADLFAPDAALIAKADADMLHRAIAALPLSYREVIVLREFEELSYREIAEILKIPLGTVMSRLARARAMLVQRVIGAQDGGRKMGGAKRGRAKRAGGLGMKIPQSWMARENAALLVNAYLDGELDAAASLQVETMMAGDAALRAEHERLLSLRLGLATHRRDDRASAGLRNRVAAIGVTPGVAGLFADGPPVDGPPVNDPPVASLPVATRFRWRQMAASAAVAACLASGATYLALTHDFTSAEVAALVAAHEHALLAPEPFEVASSDTHTVKPWFDTHVALSPQVMDLVAAGFPLAGGRMDMIDGRPVPVQVFHRRAHVISLVAIPAPGSRDDGREAVSASRDGYMVLGWHGRDFRYEAIADLSSAELTSFVAAWRSQSNALP